MTVDIILAIKHLKRNKQTIQKDFFNVIVSLFQQQALPQYQNQSLPVSVPVQSQPGATSPYPSPQPASMSAATLMPPQNLSAGPMSPGRPNSTGMCLTMPHHDNLSPRPNSTGMTTERRSSLNHNEFLTKMQSLHVLYI